MLLAGSSRSPVDTLNDWYWLKADIGPIARYLPPLGKSAQRHSCALTVDMSISGFVAIMPSAVSSG